MSFSKIQQYLQTFSDLKVNSKKYQDQTDSEFLKLKEMSAEYREKNTFDTTDGEQEYNRRKNRYRDILPFRDSAVRLSIIDEVIGSDYINANFIKGGDGCKTAYIAAQGPLPCTVDDFWRMIWEQKVVSILMACSEVESGRPKCERYWPKRKESLNFGNLDVTLINEFSMPDILPVKSGVENFKPTDLILREILVKWSTHTASGESESRLVRQFHYTAWPDHGLPENLSPILNMVALTREYQPSSSPPIIVHCSAGCGRTGTLCAIDYMWQKLKIRDFSRIKIFDLIRQFRRERPSMVQTKDQYLLVHRAIQDLYQRHLCMLSDLKKSSEAKIIEGKTRSSHVEWEPLKRSILLTLLKLLEWSKAAEQIQDAISTSASIRTSALSARSKLSDKRSHGYENWEIKSPRDNDSSDKNDQSSKLQRRTTFSSCDSPQSTHAVRNVGNLKKTVDDLTVNLDRPITLVNKPHDNDSFLAKKYEEKDNRFTNHKINKTNNIMSDIVGDYQKVMSTPSPGDSRDLVVDVRSPSESSNQKSSRIGSPVYETLWQSDSRVDANEIKSSAKNEIFIEDYSHRMPSPTDETKAAALALTRDRNPSQKSSPSSKIILRNTSADQFYNEPKGSSSKHDSQQFHRDRRLEIIPGCSKDIGNRLVSTNENVACISHSDHHNALMSHSPDHPYGVIWSDKEERIKKGSSSHSLSPYYVRVTEGYDDLELPTKINSYERQLSDNEIINSSEKSKRLRDNKDKLPTPNSTSDHYGSLSHFISTSAEHIPNYHQQNSKTTTASSNMNHGKNIHVHARHHPKEPPSSQVTSTHRRHLSGGDASMISSDQVIANKNTNKKQQKRFHFFDKFKGKITGSSSASSSTGTKSTAERKIGRGNKEKITDHSVLPSKSTQMSKDSHHWMPISRQNEIDSRSREHKQHLHSDPSSSDNASINPRQSSKSPINERDQSSDGMTSVAIATLSPSSRYRSQPALERGSSDVFHVPVTRSTSNRVWEKFRFPEKFLKKPKGARALKPKLSSDSAKDGRVIQSGKQDFRSSPLKFQTAV